VLINGTSGIGTGYSTNVPCFNPSDVVDRLRAMIAMRENGIPQQPEAFEELVPWYNGFKGVIAKDAKGNFYSQGTWRVVAAARAEITELPLGTWTQDYKALLEAMAIEGTVLKDYENQCTEKDVRFVLHFQPGALEQLTAKGTFESVFKLQTSKGLSMSNMHLYDERGAIRLYESTQAILDGFFEVRWQMYDRRKAHQLEALRRAVVICDARVRFITELIEEKIAVFNVKRAVVEATLRERGYPTDGGDGGDGDDASANTGNYDYLVKMPIYNLTLEKKEALMKEAAAKRQALTELEAMTVGRMWNEDLTTFEEAYAGYLVARAAADDDKDAAGTSGATKSKRKSAAAPKKAK